MVDMKVTPDKSVFTIVYCFCWI